MVMSEISNPGNWLSGFVIHTVVGIDGLVGEVTVKNFKGLLRTSIVYYIH